MPFAGLSTEGAINSNYRQEVREVPDAASLFVVWAAAIENQYSAFTDWPEITGTWITLRECTQRLTRLCVRDALVVGMADQYQSLAVPKAVRDQLIRTAPPHYRAAMLTVMLGDPGASMSDIKNRIGELGALGNWEEPRRRDDHQQGSRSPHRDGLRPGQGPSRSAYWRALIQTGVSPSEIDGLPTEELKKKCHKKGLKVSCTRYSEFPGLHTLAQSLRLGGNVIFGKAVKLPLKIGQLPIAEYTALVTPVKEWIIGMDVLAGMTLHLQQGKFEFGVPRPLQMKSVLVGKVKMPPFPIPLATQMVSMKQYQIPGGQEEISATIKDYVAAGVLKKCTTSWNNPIWPVRKSDGTWRMTVDYRQLNKHTPPLTSAVPDIISIIERFICLFGYWRNHIPHLGQILQPMYQVTRKKEEFTWGESQQRVFELAKEAIQQAVSLGKMMSGPVELQVSAVNDYGVHIFSDSWSVVNGLTTWVPTWKNNGWKIQNKEVWGKELWTEIWEKIQSIPVTITHVDAHTKSTEAEALHNRYIDGVFRAMQVARESSVGLARWVHQKSGHWGIQGTQQWARDRGIELKIDDIKTAIQQFFQ
uniref:RNase H type-1 domain-containing protein n=1 Tax=Poecilia latipinna TaxID=48699 RepID=A0A3B3TTT1_9TELE